MALVFDGGKGVSLPSWTTTARPSNPQKGEIGFNTSLNQLEVYNGTTWIKMG